MFFSSLRLRQGHGANVARSLAFPLTVALILLSGCSRFQPQQHEYVYVAAPQVYLHDRVAAVSNRVGMVTNGQQLEVVERGKRFIKVRTPKGEVGWLEEHAIIDDKLYAQFDDLAKKHAQDTVVATAQLRDDRNLHVLPGRDTPHFLRIPGNARLQLLARGSVAKAQSPGIPLTVKPKAAAPAPSAAGKPEVPQTTPKAAPEASPAAVPAPIPMEDWWLVRDGQGHTGWLLAGSLDVDVPEEVGAYAEGQRMVGAYALAKVSDYEVIPRDHEKGKGKAALKAGGPKATAREDASDAKPDAAPRAMKDYTEYVTALTPPHSGQPFDFDQIRVFTWSLNHHRYETAFRLHGIQGYLPVRISQEMVNGVAEPVFSFQIASSPNVTIDPDTGVTRPVAPRTLSFRLEGNLVKRTGADQAPIVLSRDGQDPSKPKPSTKKKKH